MHLLEQVEERVRNRVFSHNKALSKNERNPVFVDEDFTVECAMEHLVEALVELALEDTEI